MKLEGRALALFIFEAVMAVFYLLLGLWLIVTDKATVMIENPTVRMVVGILFLIYGIFRVYRSLRRFLSGE